MLELIEKPGHSLFKNSPRITQPMQMQDILLEPTPELFNRVEPRGIGGETQNLDRQIVLDGFRAGFSGPMGGQLRGPGKGLRLQAG